MIRRAAWIVAALTALVAVAAALGFLWLSRSGRAARTGSLRLPGLSAAVEVRWDRWGVPHVRADSVTDLAAAQGWLHANDRLVTLEMGRRRAAGRLAEVVGERALESDVEARTLRFREVAERMWSGTGRESQAWLEAYAAGVNAWLEQRGRDLPPTLALLGVRPEPWTPVDSLSHAVLMAENLSFWQGRPEELRFVWLGRFGPALTEELVGAGPLHFPLEILESARALAADAAPVPGVAAPGSNNWALGAGRSAGGPLVANDPHLRFRLPGVWYQAHLSAPGYEAAGMTLPGVPGVVIGRSPHLAWALTNVMLDDHDLFFEQVDANGGAVRRGDAWVPLERRVEQIAVRGSDAVEVELVASDRGPLLPADAAAGLPARSLAWTAYEGGDPLSAFLHLARARRVEEVPAGIADYVCPAQNLVVADRDGGLLYALLGRIPRRRAGDGALPSPGADPAYGWDGLEAAVANPTVSRPADELLVTANTDHRPPQHPLRFSADFDLPARADRIRELLLGRQSWSAADLQAVQTDVVSRYARELVELARGSYPGAAGRAYELLAGWDGRMAVRGAAALFLLFERHLLEAALADELDLARISVKDDSDWLLRLLRGTMSASWFDDVATPEVEGRSQVVETALLRAWQEGESRWGRDVGRWAYGDLHTLELRHPLGVVPVLGRWANRGPYPVPGSGTTVAAFGGRWQGGARPVTYGASMRWITDLGPAGKSWAVLPGGQAGHPADPHYDDQLELYLAGGYREVPWSEEEIGAAAVSRLTLEP